MATNMITWIMNSSMCLDLFVKWTKWLLNYV